MCLVTGFARTNIYRAKSEDSLKSAIANPVPVLPYYKSINE